MNLKDLHTEKKELQTKLFFTATDGKVVSIQLEAHGELKEHTTKVPARLICISGEVVYEDEHGYSALLRQGDFVEIPIDVKHRLVAKDFSNLILIK